MPLCERKNVSEMQINSGRAAAAGTEDERGIERGVKTIFELITTAIAMRGGTERRLQPLRFPDRQKYRVEKEVNCSRSSLHDVCICFYHFHSGFFLSPLPSEGSMQRSERHVAIPFFGNNI